MPGWLCAFVTSAGFNLVVGALLAGLVGYVAWRIQERQRTNATRKALGGLLHGELLMMEPRDPPIVSDPPTARRIVLNALPRLLAPGVVDPWQETDLYLHLIHLSSVVDDFNDKARIYNDAWARGEPSEKKQLCYNALQMSNWDYRDAHEQLMFMAERLGPPLKLGLTEEEIERLAEPGLLERIRAFVKRMAR